METSRENTIEWFGELGNDRSLRLDKENLHFEADNKLLEYLDRIGSSEVADAFRLARDRIDFWYA